MPPTSNAQHDQRYKSDADEQHYERDGAYVRGLVLSGERPKVSGTKHAEPTP